MVFASFTQEDKEAFFAILDEYFESRPHLLGQGSGPITSAQIGNAAAPAAAAFGRTVANNPQATASLVSAGLRNFPRQNASPGSPSSNSTPASEGADGLHSSVGRVASAAASFGSRNLHRLNGQAPTPPPPPSGPPAPVASSRPGPPPAPPRRGTSNNLEKAAPTGPSGLVSGKGIGGLSTASKGAMFASMVPRTKFNPPPAPPPTVLPGALPKTRNTFAPPPVRRVTPQPEPESEPEPEPEVAQEEEAGEWAQALYAYTSTDAGDLPLKEKQHVLVVERTSEDWWTGEVDGKRGLFPASYVKLIEA